MPLGSSGQPGDGPDAHSPPIWPCSRWGLAAGASPHAAGRSYRPISPLPRLSGSRRRYVSVPLSVFSARCASEPGSYPAPCPMEPGLSSPRVLHLAAATRPTRRSPESSLAQSGPRQSEGFTSRTRSAGPASRSRIFVTPGRYSASGWVVMKRDDRSGSTCGARTSTPACSSCNRTVLLLSAWPQPRFIACRDIC